MRRKEKPVSKRNPREHAHTNYEGPICGSWSEFRKYLVFVKSAADLGHNMMDSGSHSKTCPTGVYASYVNLNVFNEIMHIFYDTDAGRVMRRIKMKRSIYKTEHNSVLRRMRLRKGYPNTGYGPRSINSLVCGGILAPAFNVCDPYFIDKKGIFYRASNTQVINRLEAIVDVMSWAVNVCRRADFVVWNRDRPEVSDHVVYKHGSFATINALEDAFSLRRFIQGERRIETFSCGISPFEKWSGE